MSSDKISQIKLVSKTSAFVCFKTILNVLRIQSLEYKNKVFKAKTSSYLFKVTKILQEIKIS